MHNDQNQTQFAIGNRVYWVSQAQGNTRKKRGTIIAVVAPHESWRKAINRVGSTHTLSSFGMPRNTVSYLIVARQVGKQEKKPKLYWPLVRHLKLDQAENRQNVPLDIRTEARDEHNYLIKTYPEFTALSPAAQNALRVSLEQMGSRFK